MAGAFTPVNAPIALGLQQNQGVSPSLFAPASPNFPALPDAAPTPTVAVTPAQPAATAPGTPSTSIAPTVSTGAPAMNMKTLATDAKKKPGGAANLFSNSTFLSNVGSSSINIKTLLGS